jgi:hypothetical protein
MERSAAQFNLWDVNEVVVSNKRCMAVLLNSEDENLSEHLCLRCDPFVRIPDRN